MLRAAVSTLWVQSVISAVAGRAREAGRIPRPAGLPMPKPARLRLDQQEAQPRASSVSFTSMTEPTLVAVPFGDPAALALCVVVAHEGRDDLRQSAPRAARPSRSPARRARRGGSRSSPCRRRAAAATDRPAPTAADRRARARPCASFDQARLRAGRQAAKHRLHVLVGACLERRERRRPRAVIDSRLWRPSLSRSAWQSGRAPRSRAGCG